MAQRGQAAHEHVGQVGGVQVQEGSQLVLFLLYISGIGNLDKDTLRRQHQAAAVPEVRLERSKWGLSAAVVQQERKMPK